MNEEDNVVSVDTEQSTVEATPAVETAPESTADAQGIQETQEDKAEGTTEDTETKTGEEEKLMTKEEVSDIVVKRIDRMCKSLGFDNEEGLKEAVGRSQAYDVMKERYDAMSSENAEMKATVAMLKNNIDPSRYDDVLTYFKGKGASVDEESLKTAAATHSEWFKQTTPPPAAQVVAIGSESKAPSERDEEKAFAKAMGLPGFVD